jgi:hypothetical protein
MFGIKGDTLRLLRPVLLIAGIMLLAIPALSQSCALCYTQAAASGSRFIHSLRDGILVLIFPPMFMSVAITWLAYHKRNDFRREDETGPEPLEIERNELD